ncbi:unnamed protein product [Urochloa humidicola]
MEGKEMRYIAELTARFKLCKQKPQHCQLALLQCYLLLKLSLVVHFSTKYLWTAMESPFPFWMVLPTTQPRLAPYRTEASTLSSRADLGCGVVEAPWQHGIDVGFLGYMTTTDSSDEKERGCTPFRDLSNTTNEASSRTEETT